MAKIALIFVAVFCLVQISMAAPRAEAVPKADATTTMNPIEKAFNDIKKGIEHAMSKESLERAVKNIKELSDTIGASTKEMVDKVQAKFEQIQKEAKANQPK